MSCLCYHHKHHGIGEGWVVALTTRVSNLRCTLRPAANSSYQVDPRAVTHRRVTASVVQAGVWEVPMVLGRAMSALLLIIFTAASREHDQSSGFAGLLLPCLFPAVMLHT